MMHRHDRTCPPVHAGVRRPIRFRITGHTPGQTHRYSGAIAA
jgi:hypothetical protein